jgi:hypothetical protein
MNPNLGKSRRRWLPIAAALMAPVVLVSGATVASQEGADSTRPAAAASAIESPLASDLGGQELSDAAKSVISGDFDSLFTPTAMVLEGEASLFVPISSFRTYDSRNDPFGKWVVGDDFLLEALTDEFGDAQIPEFASAVTFNVAAVGTEGTGFIQVYGPGTDALSTSTVNWRQPGLAIANSGSTMLGDLDGEPGLMGVAVGGDAGASTHIIVDITGYYEPFNPTP